MARALSTSTRPVCLFWSEVEKWTATSGLLRFSKLPEDWKLIAMSSVVTQIENKERVEPNRQYRMAGVKWYGQGVFHRVTVLGKEQSANWLTPLKPGSLVYNRLFAWKESFAVVNSEHQSLYVSNEFPQFHIDQSVALPEYIYLLFTSRKIIKAVNAASIGSSAVSRNRFKESDFLGLKVPIPPLPVQRKIVAYWEKARVSLSALLHEKENALDESKNGLLDKVGITMPPVVPRKGRFIINLSQNERWDTFFFREDFVSLDTQIESMPHKTLGDVLNFVNRGWKPDDFSGGTFEYIEISSVTSENGIVSTKTVKVNEAPSRATIMLRAGDLIISTTRPYLGSFALVPPEYDGCVCSSGFAVADSAKITDITKDFVLWFLKSPAGLRQMERRMTGGLYPAIVQSELEKILIPCPPLEVQKAIVAAHNDYLHRACRLLADSQQLKVKTAETVEQLILGTLSVEEL